MERSSLLLNIQAQIPPTSSSSLFLFSLALSTAKIHHTRGSSLTARAEIPDGGNKGSSGDTKKPSGFGGPTETKKKTGGKERSDVIRRSPIERPSLLSTRAEEESRTSGGQQSASETAFLLTWLGLGAVILVEGLTLAASGLFPEEWDRLFVKYLYPSFTPTVLFFIGGTVAYGVVKYLQGEKMKS